jgi:hypothetical protein
MARFRAGLMQVEHDAFAKAVASRLAEQPEIIDDPDREIPFTLPETLIAAYRVEAERRSLIAGKAFSARQLILEVPREAMPRPNLNG